MGKRAAPDARGRKLAALFRELEVSVRAEPFAGRKLVPGEGNPRAGLALVGEAPGGQEERQGRPFVGPAGRLLDEALEAAGLERDAVWTTNVVKFRPTREGVGARPINRAPSRKEVSWFLPWLLRELDILAPRAIVCLGATAASALLQRPFPLTRERGQWLLGPRDVPLLATWHPAFLLRRTSDRAERQAELVADLGRAAARTQRPPRGGGGVCARARLTPGGSRR